MRHFMLCLLIALFTLSFAVTDAQAKRFGGGSSFGATRSLGSFSHSNGSRASAFSAAAPKPASSASKWLGPLAGFAAGGLLASLFMGHGLGGGMLSWVLIALAGFFIWRLVSNRLTATAPQQSTFQNQFSPQNSASFPNVVPFNTNGASSVSQSKPLGFDEAAFLRQAKATFIRLQAAYDAKNLNDIREFTTPEVSAEVQLQLQERGEAVNVTEVVSIDATLLDIATETQLTIASVQFTGLVREEVGADPVNIKEIWHFHKNNFNSNWMVAGIQQAE